MLNTRLLTIAVLTLSLVLSCTQQGGEDTDLSWLEASKTKIQDKLLTQYGEDQKEQITRGV